MDATAQRTAFVLAGGGSLGAVQVGMLRALFATAPRPDFVVGSSVGAIDAAYLAANPTPDGVADLEALWRSVRRREVFPLSFTCLAALFFPSRLFRRIRWLARDYRTASALREPSGCAHPVYIMRRTSRERALCFRRARLLRPFSPARRFPESIRRCESSGIG